MRFNAVRFVLAIAATFFVSGIAAAHATPNLSPSIANNGGQ